MAERPRRQPNVYAVDYEHLNAGTTLEMSEKSTTSEDPIPPTEDDKSVKSVKSARSLRSVKSDKSGKSGKGTGARRTRSNDKRGQKEDKEIKTSDDHLSPGDVEEILQDFLP